MSTITEELSEKETQIRQDAYRAGRIAGYAFGYRAGTRDEAHRQDMVSVDRDLASRE